MYLFCREESIPERPCIPFRFQMLDGTGTQAGKQRGKRRGKRRETAIFPALVYSSFAS
jgi:hypothetical protein